MTPRIPSGLAACWHCDGGQTEPGTIGDLCRECGGHGLVPIEEAAECVPPWEAGEPPSDEDAPGADTVAWLDDAWRLELRGRVVRTAFAGGGRG